MRGWSLDVVLDTHTVHENYVGLLLNERGEGQWRLEKNVQGTEAMEPKKRIAENGQIMVELRSLKEAKAKTQDTSQALIDGINRSEGEKITCIIADYCMGWVSKVAQKMCVGLATFCSGSAALMALIMSVHKLLDDQVINNNGKGLITKSKLTTMNYGCYENSLLAFKSLISTSMDGVGCISRVGTSLGIGNNRTFPVGDVSHPPCCVSKETGKGYLKICRVSQIKKHAGSLLEGFNQTQISSLAITSQKDVNEISVGHPVHVHGKVNSHHRHCRQVVSHITDAIKDWIEKVSAILVDGKEGPANLLKAQIKKQILINPNGKAGLLNTRNSRSTKAITTLMIREMGLTDVGRNCQETQLTTAQETSVIAGKIVSGAPLSLFAFCTLVVHMLCKMRYVYFRAVVVALDDCNMSMDVVVLCGCNPCILVEPLADGDIVAVPLVDGVLSWCLWSTVIRWWIRLDLLWRILLTVTLR
nr:UDP-glycosyltransferase 83A1-like [Tanacetum cinerariifolium]GEW37764.1 UDP-glycosyltransferase 83A1-like [Tanacetum cinerariifolium]